MIGSPRTLRLAPPLFSPPAAPAPPPPAAPADPPAPSVVLAPDAALPCTYCMSFFDGSRGGTRPSWLSDLVDDTYRMCVSGSNDPPGQLVPPPAAPSASVASGPSSLLTTGGVNTGPILYL